MHPLLKSIKELSKVAKESLSLFESVDYRKDADTCDEENLPLKLLPKPLKEIIDNLIQYCIDIRKDGVIIPAASLLNKKNMQLFIENLNISGDKTLLHQFQFIDIEPIREVAEYLAELGVKNQTRLLENVYEFAHKLKCSSRATSLCQTGCDMPTVNITFVVPSEELSDTEKEKTKLYKEFCTIFKAGILSTSQKRALYDSFARILSDGETKKPHLIVTAALCLLIKRPVYHKPLTGSFNYIRSTVFTSLGWPETTAKNYGEDSLSPGASPSLKNYQDQAAALISEALENTR